MDAELNRILETVRERLAQGRAAEAAAAVEDLHPADLAMVVEYLSEEDKLRLFGALSPATAAEVVVELSDAAREQVLSGLGTGRLSAMVDDMPSDEATDIIADLPQDVAREVLERIDQQDSDEVRELLQYPEDSAGGLMQLELVAAREDQTVAEVIEQIRRKKDEVGELHNIYVVSPDRRLLGYVPVTRLILAEPHTRIRELVEECPLVVRAHEDQEDVAHRFRRYDVVSAPVVDDQGHLLGRITIDDMMEVLEEEAHEDLMRMAGTSAEEDLFYSERVFRISRLRLPWLVVNLLGGLVTGALLWHFKVTLADALVLVTFVPVITAMGGNAGLQSSTLMVRGFAVGRITLRSFWRVLWREFRVGLVMGAACGTLVGLAANLWHHNPMLGVVVGLAMVAAINAAALMGTLAPFFFRLLGVDPAISSGPFVTTANDIVGLAIYLAIATVFYPYLTA
jgi:magnesium transporter